MPTKPGFPPVHETLSGLRAVFRDGKDVMVIQNNLKDKLYVRINNEVFILDTNQFLGALNRLLAIDIRKEDKDEQTENEI